MSTYLRAAVLAWILAGVSVLPVRAGGGAIGLDQVSEKSRKCIDCHRKENPALYGQWGSSKHFTANVGCYECHAADPADPDAYLDALPRSDGAERRYAGRVASVRSADSFVPLGPAAAAVLVQEDDVLRAALELAR